MHGQDKLDLKRARKVLDKHHAGMDDIKQRIIEFLAVGAFKGEIAGSIVLLVGPPGVGKTSIGKSIAESLGRPFYRFSVGGMRDEAERCVCTANTFDSIPGPLLDRMEVSRQSGYIA